MPLKGKLALVSLNKTCPRWEILDPREVQALCKHTLFPRSKPLIQCRKGCESRDFVGGLQSRTSGEHWVSDGSAWKVVAGRGSPGDHRHNLFPSRIFGTLQYHRKLLQKPPLHLSLRWVKHSVQTHGRLGSQFMIQVRFALTYWDQANEDLGLRRPRYGFIIPMTVGA